MKELNIIVSDEIGEALESLLIEYPSYSLSKLVEALLRDTPIVQRSMKLVDAEKKQ